MSYRGHREKNSDENYTVCRYRTDSKNDLMDFGNAENAQNVLGFGVAMCPGIWTLISVETCTGLYLGLNYLSGRIQSLAQL